MGCHTWFKVPHITDVNEIKKLALQHINQCEDGELPYYNDDEKKVMEYAVANDLIGFYGKYACEIFYGGSFLNNIIYLDVQDWSLLNEYNPKYGNSYDCRHDLPGERCEELESYWDSPRIGGYPDRVIRNYEDMIDFISTGFTKTEDGETTTYHFDKDEEHRDRVLAGIKSFFKKHPDGIITFG